LYLRIAVVVGLSWMSASARAVGLFGFSQTYLTGQELIEKAEEFHTERDYLDSDLVYRGRLRTLSIVAASVTPFAPNDGPGTDVSLKGKEAR
jgi:hypothetical protein